MCYRHVSPKSLCQEVVLSHYCIPCLLPYTISDKVYDNKGQCSLILHNQCHSHLTLYIFLMCRAVWCLQSKILRSSGSLKCQSCPALCEGSSSSLPGSSVHGILQAKILEWVAIPFFKGIFPTQRSNSGLLHCRQIL